MTIKDNDVTCERKGFLLYGQHAVISDDNDNNACGCRDKSDFSLLQVEVVDSGLNECKSKQECKKLCQYVYKRTYNLNTETSTKLCEVEI